MLEAFKDIIAPDVSAVGTHSLRNGGAIAVANAGIPDRLFMRHGRWSSDSAKDGFVEHSLSSRLSVSRPQVFSFSFSGLPGGPLNMGHSWPGAFLLGALLYVIYASLL